MTDQRVTLPIDIDRIRELLPHRYPFLLVDRVIAFEARTRLSAIKNVTINEPFFQGHFPTRPVMPGVLLIEAMAQAAGLLTQLSRAVASPGSSREPGSIFYLAKIENARFFQAVVPGDQLTLEAELAREIRNIARYQCRASVAGKVVAEAQITCADIG